MAGAITWNRLRELAAFRAQNGLAISLFLGFQPETTGTTPARQRRSTRFSTRRTSRPSAAGATSPTTRSAGFSRTSSGSELPRERLRPRGVQGLAIFAAGLDSFWSANALSEPRAGPRLRRAGLPSQAARAAARPGRGRDRRRDRPRARPALPADERTARAASRSHRGTAGAARSGRPVAGALPASHRRACEGPPAHRRRGPRQSRAPRARAPAGRGRPEEARAAFADLLAPETANCVVGSTAGEGYATPTELLELARAVPRAGAPRRGDGGARTVAGGSGPQRPCGIGLGRDARGRVRRPRRAAPLPGGRRAPCVRVSLLRPRPDSERRVPARRDADGTARGRRGRRPASRRSPTAAPCARSPGTGPSSAQSTGSRRCLRY